MDTIEPEAQAQASFRSQRALNILRKATGIAVQSVARPLSYIVFHNGVAPAKLCNP